MNATEKNGAQGRGAAMKVTVKGRKVYRGGEMVAVIEGRRNRDKYGAPYGGYCVVATGEQWNGSTPLVYLSEAVAYARDIYGA